MFSVASGDDVRRLLDATYAVIARTGSLDPQVRDVVREAGSSNKAFYRHFPSKDALLLALLDDGWRRLLDDLRRRMSRAADDRGRVEAWVRGVMAQATNAGAAERTRPFVAGMARLEAVAPEQVRRARAGLVDVLPMVGRDAQATYDVTFGAMQRHMLAGTRPTPAEVDHLVTYVLRATAR